MTTLESCARTSATRSYSTSSKGSVGRRGRSAGRWVACRQGKHVPQYGTAADLTRLDSLRLAEMAALTSSTSVVGALSIALTIL